MRLYLPDMKVPQQHPPPDCSRRIGAQPLQARISSSRADQGPSLIRIKTQKQWLGHPASISIPDIVQRSLWPVGYFSCRE